jgi:uncharacterized peroxidase-related enzyme
METLKPLTADAAPENSKATLQTIEKRFGCIPNLMGTFAHSPALLEGYVALDAAWQKSSFTATERQLIVLTASVENHCPYCVAEHSTALKALKLSSENIRALRERRPLDDPRLNALSTVTRELVSGRGLVGVKTRENFHRAGFTEIALVEVLIGVALKVMSNYLDHMNPVPIDAAFRGAS